MNASERAAQIEKTWEEIGFRARPLRDFVFVRTELLPEYIGSIFIPPSQRGNYSGLGHTVFLRSIVLATGPDCKIVKRGDRVGFQRLFFARWTQLQSGELVGWLREDQIAVSVDGDASGRWD